MWEKLLLKVRKVEEKYGDSLNAPASDEQAEILRKQLKKIISYQNSI